MAGFGGPSVISSGPQRGAARGQPGRPGGPLGPAPNRRGPVPNRVDPNALGKLWSSGQFSAPTGGKNFVSSPGITQTPAAPPAASPQTAPAPAGAPAAPQGPPLDSTYFANTSMNHFKTGNAINHLIQQGGYAKTDLATALGQLQQKQPLDTENMREKYNNQGLLYSGHLGQALGQLGQSYADKQAGLQTNYDRGAAGRNSRIAELQAGEPLFNEGQAAASTGRATTQAAADPTQGVTPTTGQSVPARFGGQGGNTFGTGGGYRVIPGTDAVIGAGGKIIPGSQIGLGQSVGSGGGFRLVPGSRTHVIGANGKVIPIGQAHLSMQQLHQLLNQRNR